MLRRLFDLTLRMTEGRTRMTRVLSSSSLRTSKDFRLIPLGIAEDVNGGR